MEREAAALPRLEYSKAIMDSVHGYIRLTRLEYDLLQLPPLNRLHNIHHLGLAYLVYPAAKTSKFEHSLGTMHLASKFIYQILESASTEELKEIFNLDPYSKEFTEKYCRVIQIVRLAGLLHDVGHGPFSHASEPILRKALKPDEIEEAKNLFGCKRERDIPVHEYFSYKMMTEKDSIIRRTIESYKINPKDVASLLIKKGGDETTRILRKIISSQLDADRMDYLLRDSYATGLPFGLTDIDRIIANTFIGKYDGKYQLVIHERALRGVEDLLDARIKMRESLYSHHLVCALEELLKMAIESMIEEGKLKYEDFRFENFLRGEIDDTFIYFKLRKYQEAHPEFRAFFDRRYIPVALIKRETDFDDFIKEIMRKLPIEPSREEVIDRFSRWLEELESGRRRMMYSGEEIILLPSSKPFSPYMIKEEERILMGRKGEKPRDLLEASSYIRALNDEARKAGKFFRISFLLPNIQKRNIKEEDIREIKELLVNNIIQLL
jgi:HD superfamily phosphohydrolase